MKARLTTFIFGLSMLFALGSMATPADAQVVVKIGPQHRYYHHHHRYYHTYYRHGHAYRSYRPY
jgi:hypothetical protein